jgi:hypothetical protein
MSPKYDVVRSTFATWGVSCCRGRPRSATIVSVPAPGFRAESANVPSSFAFLLAALMAFRRWRQAGGDDIASLRLIIAVAAVGLRSFAFHALATLGAAVLDVGPIAVFICSTRSLRCIGSCGCRLRSPSAPCSPSWRCHTTSRPDGHPQRLDRLCCALGAKCLVAALAWGARDRVRPKRNRRDRVSPGKQSVHGELVGCCSRHWRVCHVAGITIN